MVQTGFAARSVTGVEYPLDVNRASLRALQGLPGVGAKRTARIVRRRAFRTLADFAVALDDVAVAKRVEPFVSLAS